MKGPFTHAASSARTTTGTSTSAVVDAGASALALLVNAATVSGTTPTLDITVEWSNDNATWAVGEPADSFTQITAAKVVAKQFAVKGAYYRTRWTIGGTTPSFTFDVTSTVIN